jgi:very-short-patch-repair endonuclease
MDPVVVIARSGGIASARQLADAGCHPRLVALARESGSIVRIRRGWYATPHAPQPVVSAVRAGGRLGCCSALRLSGVWVLDDDVVHVTVGAGAHPSLAGSQRVKLHWAGTGLDNSYPMTGVLEALDQYVRCGSEVAVVAAADSALNQGLATESEVLAMLSKTARGRRIAARLDPNSQSGLESIARFALVRHGIKLRTQVFVAGVGRVDLIVGDRLVIELDGEEWHGGARFEEDRRRDLALVAAGYLVVRLSYKQVLGDWATVESSLLAIIRRRDHQWRGQFRRSS